MADRFYCNKCGNFTDVSDHGNADGGGCQYLGVLVPRPDPEPCPHGADKPEATIAIFLNCFVAWKNAVAAESNAAVAAALADSTRRLKAIAQVAGEFRVSLPKEAKR